ncbi:hypothetical protein A9C19_07815 [Bacillus weihaiensis]|uniref:SnoaL-like domain-containing protein n=1 Tax=Bacillus weihaiensis TaxID=1547283 RepID=A0A1L3MXE6_9BACI|nr:hypothetical protein A9C19_07815 [Bacillus weihaiensis]
MKIVSTADCENSPKKKFLIEFIMAFATNDFVYVSENTSKDLYWDIVNNTLIKGHEEVKKVLASTSRISEIEILTIITHGKTASINGTVRYEQDSIYSFCSVYTFVSAGKNTIKAITSYVIKMN